MSTMPLIKWPGGKRAIAPQIASIFPTHFDHYFEPFVGGAALFFLLNPKKALLSDKNEGLINLYKQVRDYPHELIERLNHYVNDKESYYHIRASDPADDLGRAARIYYLMLLSFNGIYRVNLKGQFNVPYGFKTHLKVVESGKILQVSNRLASIDILNLDFESAVNSAKPGDAIYFDPPYTVAHSQNGFVKYNEDIFSFDDQQRLASCASSLVERGCFVAVSNANHPSIAALYSGFHLKTILRTSKIAARAEHRVQIEEHVYYLGG